MLMKKIQYFGLAMLTLLASEAVAKVSQEEADKLGKELTPIGAERAGNADGTIPEWTGGYDDPNGYDSFGELKNPYPDDKILFTITAQNADQYKDKLSPGQYALLKKYPSMKMNIYPTRRTAGYFDFVVEALKDNALNAETIEDFNGIIGARVASPFPIPKNGNEVVWNSIASFFVNQELTYTTAAPTASGAYTPNRYYLRFSFPYSQKGATIQSVDNILWKQMIATQAPPLDAGTSILLIEHFNQKKEPRDAWQYSPGTRRVRRAPVFTFDSAAPGSDNQIWIDLFVGFNGSQERYNFKLLGKQEIYIPYNNYKLMDRSLKYSDIVKPGHLNPDYIRYELHRVWVVEATLKSGASHISPKRVLYFDEDTYIINIADLYDSRMNLWRVMELYEPLDYVAKGRAGRMAGYFDLANGRYYYDYLRNEEKMPFKRGGQFSDTLFTQETLQSEGR